MDEIEKKILSFKREKNSIIQKGRKWKQSNVNALDLAMDRVSVQVKRMDNGNMKQVKKPYQESDQCQNEIEFVQTLADNFNCLNIPESFVCLVDGILLRELMPVAEAWDEGMATILAAHPSDEVESRRLQESDQQVKVEPVFESGLESRIQELRVESMCWNELKTSVESFSMNEWKENLL